MSDLFVGIALVLVIEGLVWALAPHFAVQLLQIAASTPERSLRSAGWLAVVIGAALVWLVRG